jgi:hypothetical protein
MKKTIFVDSDEAIWDSKEEFLSVDQPDDCTLGEYTLKATYKLERQLVLANSQVE